MGHDSHGSCSQGSCSCSQGCSSKKQGGNCCGCQNCKCSCHQNGKYADELLQLADDAWMELLKEQIKEEIRTNGGDQINQLAKLVSTANHARWKDKMQSKKDHENFECQLKSALCGNCDSSKK